MNLEYKDILIKFKDRLKQTVDLTKLGPQLVKRGIAYNSNDPNDFYNSLCSKDPYAFLKFIHILSQCGYVKEATLLQNECSKGQTPPTYKMSSKPVGLCLIINNINFSISRTRDESQFDVSALESLFECLGFKVSVEEDLTAQKMTDCLEQLSRNPELKRVDSLIVFILTHGKRLEEHNADVLRGIDEEEIVLKNVYRMFNHENCKMLLGKPKMFFFQACRGKKTDLGRAARLKLDNTDITTLKTNASTSFALVHVPSITDTIVVHSTMPCHLSINDDHQGSWFCQELVPVFTADYTRHDLLTMLKTVSKRMENRISGDKYKQAVHVELFSVTGIVKFGQDSKRKLPSQDISEAQPSRKRTRNAVRNSETLVALTLMNEIPPSSTSTKPGEKIDSD